MKACSILQTNAALEHPGRHRLQEVCALAGDLCWTVVGLLRNPRPPDCSARGFGCCVQGDSSTSHVARRTQGRSGLTCNSVIMFKSGAFLF